MRKSVRKALYLLSMFLLPYSLLVLAQALGIAHFDTPTHFIYPLIGFSLLYVSSRDINEYSGTKIGYSPVFPALFILLSIAGYYLGFILNFQQLHAVISIPEAFAKASLAWLEDSPFILFILFGIWGWITRILEIRVIE